MLTELQSHYWKLIKTILVRSILITSTLPMLSFGSVSLVSTDWKNQGDELITYDTDSGLEWLDLSVTTNMSHNFVLTQFGVGGLYEGWNYADEEQVLSLFYGAGGEPQFGAIEFASTEQLDANKTLLSFWSETGSTFSFFDPNWHGSEFFYHDERYSPGQDPSTWQALGIVLYLDTPTRTVSRLDANYGSAKPDDEFTLVGSALVRQHIVSQVPLPASGWLFISMIGSSIIAKSRLKSNR